MSRRLIVIPRWSGWPESDWYPWLERTLQAEPKSLFDEIVIGDMPAAELADHRGLGGRNAPVDGR